MSHFLLPYNPFLYFRACIMVSIAVFDPHDCDFMLYLNFQGEILLSLYCMLSLVMYILICFIIGKDCRFPLPLRRCLLGFREGMELFKFGLGRLTGVLRQKGFVYDLGGASTGTVLEVCFCLNTFFVY